MSKSIHLCLPKDLERAIPRVLETDTQFESQSHFIRDCIRKRIKEDYLLIYEEVVKKYEKKR